jgi:acyl-homoserine lactone acylase PvdQ
MMRDLGLSEVAEDIAENMKREDPIAYEDFSAFVQGINDNVAIRPALPL